MSCYYLPGESIPPGVSESDQEEGAVGGQGEDMPNLEADAMPEAGTDMELQGEAESNEENVFPEVVEPVAPTPLLIDPSGE